MPEFSDTLVTDPAAAIESGPIAPVPGELTVTELAATEPVVDEPAAVSDFIAEGNPNAELIDETTPATNTTASAPANVRFIDVQIPLPMEDDYHGYAPSDIHLDNAHTVKLARIGVALRLTGALGENASDPAQIVGWILDHVN